MLRAYLELELTCRRRFNTIISFLISGKAALKNRANIHNLKDEVIAKKTKFTEQQIAFALKPAETGKPVDEVCRKMGISATLYNWEKEYGDLGISELRRLQQLED